MNQSIAVYVLYININIIAVIIINIVINAEHILITVLSFNLFIIFSPI